MNIEAIKGRIYNELGSLGKPISIYCEGTTLKVNFGGSVSEFYNWHLLTPDDIIRTVKTSVLKENRDGRVLLNEVRIH